MRVEGWLLDVRVSGDEAHLWVRDPRRGRVKLFDRYRPDFYAEPRGMEAHRLRDLLEEHDDLAGVTVERRLSSIQEPREVEVLRLRVRGRREVPPGPEGDPGPPLRQGDLRRRHGARAQVPRRQGPRPDGEGRGGGRR